MKRALIPLSPSNDENAFLPFTKVLKILNLDTISSYALSDFFAAFRIFYVRTIYKQTPVDLR